MHLITKSTVMWLIWALWNCQLFGAGWLGGGSSLLLLLQTGSSHSAACRLVLWKKTAVNASQYNMIQEEAAQGAAGVWVSNLNRYCFHWEARGPRELTSIQNLRRKPTKNDRLVSKLKTEAWEFRIKLISHRCPQNIGKWKSNSCSLLTRGPPAVRATVACALLRSFRSGWVVGGATQVSLSRSHAVRGGWRWRHWRSLALEPPSGSFFRDITHVLCAVLLLSRFVLRVPRAGESLDHFCLDRSKND